MKHLSILGSIILALVFLTSLNAGQWKQEKATVHIVVVDGFGRNLGVAEVESFKYGERQDFARHFQRNTAKEIPYGDYKVRVHQTGYHSGEITAQVFQPDVWVVVGLSPGGTLRGEYPGARLQMTGTVKNIDPSEQPVYIRLAAVYSNFMMDTKVNVRGQSGTFTLAGVIPDGEYILMTIGRTRLLDVRQFKVAFPAKEPIMIDLEQAAGKRIVR